MVGSPICPAAMYLELASHAIALLFNTQMMTATSEITVETLEIKVPLGLDKQRSVRLTLTEKMGRVWGFELSSTKNNDKSTSHATGIISMRDSNTSINNEQDEKEKWARTSSLLEKDTDTEALCGTMVYKVFNKMAKYSSVYRGLRYLASKGSEGAGDITMPANNLDMIARTPNDSIADPLVMDNFLQVPGVFVHSLRGTDDDDGDISYICTGMDSVGPLNGLQGSGQYRVYTKIVREDNKDAVLDVFTFDKQSRKIIWSAKGLKFSRVPRNFLAKVLAGANPGMEFKEQSAGASKPAAQSPARRRPYQTIPTAPPKGSSRGDRNSADVLTGVQEILSKSLDVPVEEITEQASLEELGTDSLVSPEILAKISDKFEIDISTDEFVTVTNVTSLCDLISSRVGGDPTDNSSEGNEDQGLYSAFETADDATSEWQQIIFEILSQSLDIPVVEIQIDSKLEDLGADSLVAGEIISNLNEALGLNISLPEFASIVDVISLCKLIGGALGIDSMQTPAASSSDVFPTPSISRTDIPVTSHTGTTTPTESEKPSQTEGNPGSIHTAFQQICHCFDAHAQDTNFTGF